MPSSAALSCSVCSIAWNQTICVALRPPGPFDSSAAGNQTALSILQLAWLEICYQVIHTHVHSVCAECPFSVWLKLLQALRGSVWVPSTSGLGVLLFVTVLLPPLPQGLDIWEFITSPVSCLTLYAEKPATRYPYIPHIFRRTWEKTPSNWSDKFVDGTEAELPFLHKADEATGNTTVFNLCLVSLIQPKGISL